MAPIRKRLKRREIPGGVRFFTFSCEQRLALLSNPAIADLFAVILRATHARLAFELFAWVVMPEHVHLLVRPPPRLTLDRVLASLKVSVSTTVLPRWKRLRAPVLPRLLQADGTFRFWQKGGGFDRNVRDETELLRETRYIHRNPVERGLVENPEDWKWSSVRWWMGMRDGEIPCNPPPGDPRAWAAWKGYK